MDPQISSKTAESCQPHVDRFATQLKDIVFDFTSLDRQRQRFGSLLKKPYPLGTKENSSSYYPVSFLTFDPVGAETQAFIDAVLEEPANPQQRKHITGLAQASGAGKTKMMFSLGMLKVHGVFIRLSLGSNPSAAMGLLKEKINEIAEKTRGHLNSFGLYREGVKEAEIPATTHDFLLKAAQEGLDVVRMYVFSHVQWLIHLDRAVRALYSSSSDSPWNSQAQRHAWILSLQNGIGNKGVCAIFKVYLSVLEDKSFVSRDCAAQLMTELRNCLVDDDGRPAPNLPVFFGFDEIGYAKGKGSGVWYHTDEFNAKSHVARIRELVTPSPQTYSRQLGDLFFAFKIIMSNLYERYQAFAVMADTNFSIFDIQDEQAKSPLNPYLKKWENMHSMSITDILSELTKHFDVTLGQLEPVRASLERFTGRPRYFFSDFLMPFLASCEKKKPSSPQEFIALVTQESDGYFSEAKKNFRENVVAVAWGRSLSERPDISRTVASRIRQLHYDLVFSVRPTPIDIESFKVLASTGLLFGFKQEGEKIYLDFGVEPISREGLQEFGDMKLREESDHILTCITEGATSSSLSFNTVKGEMVERLAMWSILRVIKMSGPTPQEILGVLRDANILPIGFDVPFTLLDTYFIQIQKADLSFGRKPLKVNTMTSDTLYGNLPQPARVDLMIPLVSDAGQSINGFLAIQAKSGLGSLCDCLCSVTPGCFYLPGKPLNVLQNLRRDQPEVLPSHDWTSFMNGVNSKVDHREQFAANLPGNPFLRAVFSIGGFSEAAINLVNAYNASSEHPVLLLAPQMSSPFWKSVLKLFGDKPKEMAMDTQGAWALEMWTCQESKAALERQVKLQEGGAEDVEEMEMDHLRARLAELEKKKAKRSQMNPSADTSGLPDLGEMHQENPETADTEVVQDTEEEWVSFGVISLFASLDDTIKWLTDSKIPAGTSFYLHPQNSSDDSCEWSFDLQAYFRILGFKYGIVGSTVIIDEEGDFDPKIDAHELKLLEDGTFASRSSASFEFKSDFLLNQFLTVGVIKVQEEVVLEALLGFRQAQLGKVRWDPPLSKDFCLQLPKEEIEPVDVKSLPIFHKEDEVFESHCPSPHHQLESSKDDCVSCGFYVQRELTTYLVTVAHFLELNKTEQIISHSGHSPFGYVAQDDANLEQDYCLISLATPPSSPLSTAGIDTWNVKDLINQRVFLFTKNSRLPREGCIESLRSCKHSETAKIWFVAITFKGSAFTTTEGDCGGLYVVPTLNDFFVLGIHRSKLLQNSGGIPQGSRICVPASNVLDLTGAGWICPAFDVQAHLLTISQSSTKPAPMQRKKEKLGCS